MLVADELTGVSRQEDINSVQGGRLHTVSKSVCTVKISKFIHFPKNNIKWRYVFTVVITSHTLITNEIHNNRVFVSLLSPLAEPADSESETDGYLTRMGPRSTDNDYLSNFPWPSLFTVQSC